MHRLSRQVLCPRSISRVVRVHRHAGSSSSLNAVLGRHYASSNRPIPLAEKFDRLFASLRPKMEEDELAMTIAALIKFTRNASKKEKLRSAIPKLINAKGVDKDSLEKKVNDLLVNPPADNFESFLARLPAEGASKSAAADQNTNNMAYIDGLPDDPSLPHPFDQLMEHLQRPEVRRILEPLPALAKEEIMLQVRSIAREPDDMDGLVRIAELLAEYEVPIRYRRRVQPAVKEAEEQDFLKYLAEIRGEESDLNQETLKEEQKPVAELEKVGPQVTEATEEAEAPKPPPPNPFPNLMVSDPLLDSRDVLELPPDKDTPFHNRVIVRNHSSIFNEALAEDGFDFGAEDYVPTKTDMTEESASSLENLPFSPAELANFYRFPLIHKRITQQTGKGKIHRQFVLMVVGNGDGMVGLGQGKDDDASRAEAKAFAQAVRNMDWVERFEKRTIWTDMETKLGATQLIMRPRPVGFGLRCNPNLHQVLKAAGIKDISAKVWGSRNPINVIKAAFRMLQAGHAPLAMGDGIGGPGRKLNKGSGLRSKSDVERERGRQLISLRK
ncbi:putative ribosomal protein S5 domain 2-like protein [Lyophyllum shimeji]|uniref:Small ribosomal subunit protein uS5m n=1 Tax=Lyophyllum shimeji TaxID=47721 RepID=A0A9P3PXU2_LYOSH|nr:putative ribosomal protein S5 domain 2-like protein [Lyophyllum shimeji]